MSHLLLTADARRIPLADGSVQCCVTSPPYWGLRDYKVDRQLGLEPTPEAYVSGLVAVFREVRRVLRGDGTCWLNLGDSYSMSTRGKGGDGKQCSNAGTHHDREWQIGPGLKPKDLVGIPWRVAFALQADGWYLRSDIIWAKPNPMPESVADRPTKSHEYLFLLSKSERYFWDAEAVREKGTIPAGTFAAVRGEQAVARAAAGGRLPSGNEVPGTGWTYTGNRNVRSVWTIAPRPYAGAHFAVMPGELARRCIMAGSRPGDVVLDPFSGAGTVPMTADGLGRHGVGLDLNPAYCRMAAERIRRPHKPHRNRDDAPLLLPGLV